MKNTITVNLKDEHTTEYDFSSFGFDKRLQIAITIFFYGRFTFISKNKSQVNYKFK